MKDKINIALRDRAESFRLPRYSELPTVGLYLEQVAKYINSYISVIGCLPITTSMISNYVKKGFIKSPVKKQYDPERIAYLIFIAIAKNVVSLENMTELLEMQKKSYTLPVAYDYFCCEFENMIQYLFGLKELPEANIGSTESQEKQFLKNVIISASHSIYLGVCFDYMKNNKIN
jgi:hypothetical protein